MKERIYSINVQGKLSSIQTQRFEREVELQELIAEHPELLDGDQIDPDNPRRWILVQREIGIADSEGSGDRWSLDHLFIDQDGVPTLVEVKRGADSRIRREVVGQMLDYAAHAPTSWSAQQIRQTFEKNPRAEAQLQELLQSDADADIDAFWKQVELNLDAKHLRLLFVADYVPDELARVVEFLNEQMRLEVLAVELKQFPARSSRTLVPRVFGRLAAKNTATGRKRQTTEEFIARFGKAPHREAVARLLETSRKRGASHSGQARISIRAGCPRWRNPTTVAWLTPPGDATAQPFDANHFLFGVFQSLNTDDVPIELRARLDRWRQLFAEHSEFVPLPNPWSATKPSDYDGYPCYAVPYDIAAKRLDWLVDGLGSVSSDLAAL